MIEFCLGKLMSKLNELDQKSKKSIEEKTNSLKRIQACAEQLLAITANAKKRIKDANKRNLNK